MACQGERETHRTGLREKYHRKGRTSFPIRTYREDVEIVRVKGSGTVVDEFVLVCVCVCGGVLFVIIMSVGVLK